MNTAYITSLAILKVHYDRKEDFLEQFVPIVSFSAYLLDSDTVSLIDIKNKLKSEFHFEIPQNTLKTILKRASRRGYININYKLYEVIKEKIQTLNIPELRSSIQRKQNALITGLIRYSIDKYSKSLNKKEAEDALLSFLNESDIAVLIANIDGGEIKPMGKSINYSPFIVSNYLIHVQKSDPEKFEFFLEVAKGNILANSVYYPDVGKLKSYFKKSKFFLDTGILLKALGYEGELIRQPIIEMIDLLLINGATVNCFDHTLRELKAVIKSAAIAIRNNTYEEEYHSIDYYFLRNKLTYSDIILFEKNAEKNLNKLKINVVKKEAYSLTEPINLKDLSTYLKREVGYRSEQSLSRDCKSIEGIIQNRANLKAEYIEDAKSIFVTSNFELAYACKKYFDKIGFKKMAPIIVPDDQLTTYVWLKQPYLAPDLPRKLIIAECYAAMNPTREMWAKYINTSKNLLEKGDVTADDYMLLKGEQAKDMLVEISLNEPDNVTKKTSMRILADIKAQLKYEAQVGLRKQILDIETDHGHLIDRVYNQSNHFHKISDNVGKIFTIILYILITLIISVSSYFLQHNVLANLIKSCKTNKMISLCLILVCIIIADTYSIVLYSKKVKQRFGKTRKNISNKIYNYINKKFGIT